MGDMRDLANSLVANGQFHLPPNDVMRLGQVIGYDPNYDSTAGTHDHPLLTVTMAGDATPLHAVRFAETYTPNLGDTVWILVSGEDAFVTSRLADVANGNGTVRSPTTPGISGHGAFADTTVIPTSGVQTTLNGTAITTGILPNRIYKVEINCSFTVSSANASDTIYATWANNASTLVVTVGSPGVNLSRFIGSTIAGDGIPPGATILTAPNTVTGSITISANTSKAQSAATICYIASDHFVSTGVITPSGYQAIIKSRVVNGQYTVSGHTTWFSNSTGGTYPYNWTTTHPNAQFSWKLASQTSSSGGTAPQAVGSSQRIVIHDLGVAS